MVTKNRIEGHTMRIYSIFQSVDGEVNSRGMGAMTTFIRFAGCSAQCSFCDTEYAKDKNSGVEMTVEEVMKKVSRFECNNVTITGGEPLEQPGALLELLFSLTENQYNVSIETNGFHPFTKSMHPYNKVNWVVDIKKEGKPYKPTFVAMCLTYKDYIKQVVGSKSDFVVACAKKRELQNDGVRATFAFSPEYGKVTPDELVKWMKEYKEFDSVLNVQLHKVLNLSEDN